MASWLLERLASFGERPSLLGGDGAVSFAALRAEVEAWRGRLRAAQVEPGAVVALRGGFAASSVAALLALHAEGVIVAPMADLDDAEAETRTCACAAQWTLDARVGEIRRCEARPAHEFVEQLRAKGHGGLVLFSSGMTGKPKAMIHDLDQLLESYAGKRPRRVVFIAILLFDHIGGLNTLFHALATGAAMVLPEARDPETIARLVARHGVGVLPASPTFLNLMLMAGVHKRHDLSSLRLITYGTEPMPEGLLRRLRAAFPRAKFVQTFGTSETGISQTTSKSSDSTLFKLDDPNLETKIVDGELWLRSRTQVLGYLNADMGAFTEEGWFRTGDLVEEAGEGFLRIVGRGREVINVGGQKVLPAEVESVLLQMPEVADCLVRGEANAITGQIVVAQVVGKDGLDRGQVRRFCREHLEPYKVPTKVKLVEAIATTARFKKQRLH